LLAGEAHLHTHSAITGATGTHYNGQASAGRFLLLAGSTRGGLWALAHRAQLSAGVALLWRGGLLTLPANGCLAQPA